MASFLESGLQHLTIKYSNFQLATFGLFILHECVFLLSALPWLFLERSELFSKYKIQKKYNRPEAHWRCLVKVIGSHFLVMLPMTILYYPLVGYSLKCTLPLPSWSVIVSQITYFFVLEDYAVYWVHRMLHTKWFYQRLHKVHHEYSTPFSLISQYGHPVELLIFGFCIALGPTLTGVHVFTYWLWICSRSVAGIESHYGYDFPWTLSNFLPFYGGAEFHDSHHRLLYTQSGNYAPTFTYLDWLYGTHKDYKKHDRQRENSKYV